MALINTYITTNALRFVSSLTEGPLAGGPVLVPNSYKHWSIAWKSINSFIEYTICLGLMRHVSQ